MKSKYKLTLFFVTISITMSLAMHGLGNKAHPKDVNLKTSTSPEISKPIEASSGINLNTNDNIFVDSKDFNTNDKIFINNKNFNTNDKIFIETTELLNEFSK